MTTKDPLGVRVVKHGLCAATMAALLVIAFTMASQVFERSVADLAFQQQNERGVTFDE
jgi:hypothetical protein